MSWKYLPQPDGRVRDEELGEDYAKLGGLTAEEDLNETTLQSTKKRLPWLIILLFLGMGVSSVVGMFETVVAVIPIVICFQSLILDMAGNVGTQSLAVTIRVLMDENLKASDKVKLMFKEVRVGFSNGLLLGTMSFIFVGLYIFLFNIELPPTFKFFYIIAPSRGFVNRKPYFFHIFSINILILLTLCCLNDIISF
mgnify:CR=1 FL=1